MTRSAKKTNTGMTGVSDLTTAMMGGNPAAAKVWADIMTESTRFVSDRLQQDVETQHAMLRCKTPADVVQLQSAFFQKAIEQYTDEAKRLFEIMTDATEGAVKDTKSGKSRGYDDVPV